MYFLLVLLTVACRVPPDDSTIVSDRDGDGFLGEADCDDADASAHPGAADDPYDGHDAGCDGEWDADGDGRTLPEDCDDEDPAVPGAEVPYDGADNDCDPATPDDDLDHDGAVRAVDCDDADPARSPAVREVPYDGVDNDCDPDSPDDDLDGDGFLAADDCDDGDAAVSPADPEVPGDGVDNDCDPATTDADADGDGVLAPEDCDDGDPTVYPGAPDHLGDGVDGDCDGGDCMAFEEGGVRVVVCDTVGVTWAEAEAACLDAGYDGLFEPSRSELQAAFEDAVDASPALHRTDFWIGLTRTGSTWGWRSGDPVSYGNWSRGEPSGGSTETCGMIFALEDHRPLEWNDAPCSFTYDPSPEGDFPLVPVCRIGG